ncbi:PREDICTED: agouti-related protein [Gekko japonicus]|uniref:Agouti-related protein n=1 Tax=Gekko japonicus TaxID=146911 RepID=A0ABM1JQZ4_GEKJA|nr:PREDICTED: agouti-related protein [Gekko japonicus]
MTKKGEKERGPGKERFEHDVRFPVCSGIHSGGSGKGRLPKPSATGQRAPPDFEQLALEVPIAQDDLVPEASMIESQMLSSALQVQGREERSPRRCVRLQESCLGHKLPCCDPCATCYCRFFNANCFCKKFSSTFPCGKN